MDHMEYHIHQQIQGKLSAEITDLNGNAYSIALGDVNIPIDLAVSTGHGPTPQEKINELNAIIDEMAEAIRLTVEYTGTETLPAIEGWSWYDALKKHRPEQLKGFEKTEPVAL